MSYSPYVPDIQAWVEHFKNKPKNSGIKKFYTIGRPKQHGEKMDPIKLVTPTEQVVQQAKSELKSEREEDKATVQTKRRKSRRARKTLNEKSKDPKIRRSKKRTKKIITYK